MDGQLMLSLTFFLLYRSRSIAGNVSQLQAGWGKISLDFQFMTEF